MQAPETQSTASGRLRSTPAMWYRRVAGLSGHSGARAAWRAPMSSDGNRRPVG
jgi:hypothetical protein